MTSSSAAPIGWPLIGFCLITKIALLALAGDRYGYLSDELYFLDAARHLDLGYVDFPPLIAWLVAAAAQVSTDLLFLRAIAAALGLAVVVTAVALCRQLGGGTVAQWLTAFVVLFAPAFLSVHSLLTMNVLDHLWWLLAVLLYARYLEARRPNDMIWLGVVMGTALLTKLSIVVLGVALVTTTLLFARWLLARWESWLALAISLAMALPYVFWQVGNDWPLLEFIAAYNASSPEPMVIEQPLLGLVLTLSPAYAPIWLAGIAIGLWPRRAIVTPLTVAMLLAVSAFLIFGVKFYFASPAFAVFVAVGAIFWERVLADRPMTRNLFMGSMLVGGLLNVPISVPVLSPPVLQSLVDFMRQGETGETSAAPALVGRYFPHFAEMHGWPELVDAVANAMTASDAEGATLVAAYYGQSGALNHLDEAERLPEAYGGHMSYALWNGDADLSRVVFVGFETSLLEPFYDSVSSLGGFDCPRCMERERQLEIVLAEDLRVPAATVRQAIRRFYFF